MKRLTLAALAVALLGAACGTQASPLGPAPTGGSSTPSVTPSESPLTGPSSSPARTMTFQVWFAMGDRLFVTRRTEPFSSAIGRASLEAMLNGPSAAEHDAGVATVVPAGTKLLGLEIGGGIARVNFSSEFRTGGDPPALTVGQVVYTIGQFSTVDQVVIEVNGGELFETPQTKDGYESVLPAIVVLGPSIGQTVSNPVTVSGTADVFEATVSLRILDQNGKEIARAFTTATCGTGCRGDYSTSMSYKVDNEQPGTIEVFESSAKDGSPINVVSIPVTLST
jgi:hypothetical protein